MTLRFKVTKDWSINDPGAGHVDEPPTGATHYVSEYELPENYRKYFHQRFDIFSRYDEGIWMTEDAWMGVTPQVVAEYVFSLLLLSFP